MRQCKIILQRLEALLRGDKVCVAFVAEFSRGKSEVH